MQQFSLVGSNFKSKAEVALVGVWWHGKINPDLFGGAIQGRGWEMFTLLWEEREREAARSCDRVRQSQRA